MGTKCTNLAIPTNAVIFERCVSSHWHAAVDAVSLMSYSLGPPEFTCSYGSQFQAPWELPPEMHWDLAPLHAFTTLKWGGRWELMPFNSQPMGSWRWQIWYKKKMSQPPCSVVGQFWGTFHLASWRFTSRIEHWFSKAINPFINGLFIGFTHLSHLHFLPNKLSTGKSLS